MRREDLIRSLPAGTLLLIPVGEDTSWLVGWTLRDCAIVRVGAWEYDDAVAGPPDPKKIVPLLRGSIVMVFHDGTPGRVQTMRLGTTGDPFWAQTEPVSSAFFDEVPDEHRAAVVAALRERWPSWAEVDDLVAVEALRPGAGATGGVVGDGLKLVDKVKRRFGR